MTPRERTDSLLAELHRRSLRAGLIAAALCVLGAILSPGQFFRSYLMAYLFWIGLPLGGWAIFMLHTLTGGAWGWAIRRIIESGMRTLPFMALLFIPVLLGMSHLYIWDRPDEVAGDPLLRHKHPYLNGQFFLLRAAIYFGVWIILGSLARRWAVEPAELHGFLPSRRARVVGAAGLLLYALTITFASIDWAMSLQPEWFSTIYGALFMVGYALSTLAFSICLLGWLLDSPAASDLLARPHLNDLGNLLLTFVVLWAYLSFSQYLIIWSGNLPEEITWYHDRGSGFWKGVGVMLMIFHFLVPFLLLLSRTVKRRLRMMGMIASGVIIMRVVDMIWMVGPSFPSSGFFPHLLDPIAFVAIGGLWVAFLASNLREREILPPLLAAASAPEHH